MFKWQQANRHGPVRIDSRHLRLPAPQHWRPVVRARGLRRDHTHARGAGTGMVSIDVEIERLALPRPSYSRSLPRLSSVRISRFRLPGMGLPSDSGNERAWLCRCRASTRRLPRFLEGPVRLRNRCVSLRAGGHPLGLAAHPLLVDPVECGGQLWKVAVAVDVTKALLCYRHSRSGPSQAHRRRWYSANACLHGANRAAHVALGFVNWRFSSAISFVSSSHAVCVSMLQRLRIEARHRFGTVGRWKVWMKVQSRRRRGP